MRTAPTPTPKQTTTTQPSTFVQAAATTNNNPYFGGPTQNPTQNPPAQNPKNTSSQTPPVDPADQAFTTKARAAGLTDQQIAVGLMRKKQMVASGGFNADGTPSTDTSTGVNANQGDPAAAFGGRTKQQVLSLAFQSGIRDASTLKNIGDTYDLVTGAKDKTPEQIKQADYTKAQQFIADNPHATREDLASHILQYTQLTSTDINSMLDQTGALAKKDIAPLTDNNLQSIASELVKANSGLFSDSQKGLVAAQQQVDAGKININNKQVQLSPDQIDKIKQYMQKEYPNGRTLLQKVLNQ